VRRQLVRRKNPNRGTKTDFHGNFQGRNSCLEKEENRKPATLRNPKKGRSCAIRVDSLMVARGMLLDVMLKSFFDKIAISNQQSALSAQPSAPSSSQLLRADDRGDCCRKS
jgi:hypothetical protein